MSYRSIGKESNAEFKLLTKNSFRSLIERAAKSEELADKIRMNRIESANAAFTDIMRDEACKNLLRELLKSPVAITMDQITDNSRNSEAHLNFQCRYGND